MKQVDITQLFGIREGEVDGLTSSDAFDISATNMRKGLSLLRELNQRVFKRN